MTFWLLHPVPIIGLFRVVYFELCWPPVGLSNFSHSLVNSITSLTLLVKVNKLVGIEEIFPHFFRGHTTIRIKNSVHITLGVANNVVFLHVGADIPGGIKYVTFKGSIKSCTIIIS